MTCGLWTLPFPRTSSTRRSAAMSAGSSSRSRAGFCLLYTHARLPGAARSRLRHQLPEHQVFRPGEAGVRGDLPEPPGYLPVPVSGSARLSAGSACRWPPCEPAASGMGCSCGGRKLAISRLLTTCRSWGGGTRIGIRVSEVGDGGQDVRIGERGRHRVEQRCPGRGFHETGQMDGCSRVRSTSLKRR